MLAWDTSILPSFWSKMLASCASRLSGRVKLQLAHDASMFAARGVKMLVCCASNLAGFLGKWPPFQNPTQRSLPLKDQLLFPRLRNIFRYHVARVRPPLGGTPSGPPYPTSLRRKRLFFRTIMCLRPTCALNTYNSPAPLSNYIATT